jgi:hypothetical protein
MGFQLSSDPLPPRDQSHYDNDVALLYAIRGRIEAVVPSGARNCPNLMTIDRVLTAFRAIEAEKRS